WCTDGQDAALNRRAAAGRAARRESAPTAAPRPVPTPYVTEAPSAATPEAPQRRARGKPHGLRRDGGTDEASRADRMERPRAAALDALGSYERRIRAVPPGGRGAGRSRSASPAAAW